MRGFVVAGLVVFHSAVAFASGASWFVTDPRPSRGSAPRTTITLSCSAAPSMTRDDNHENTIPVRSSMSHPADHHTRDSSRQSLTRCYHRKGAGAAVFTLLRQGKSTVLYR